MKHRVSAAPFMVLAVIMITLAGTGGCTRNQRPVPRIAFTSILPQKDFVEHIAGNRFEVHALVGPGQSPHSYTPTPAQMARLSEAAVLFRTGVEFEEGILPRLRKSLPNLLIVDLRATIVLRDMTAQEAHHHHHRDDEDPFDDEDHKHANHDHARHPTHQHGHARGKDPHIWLSPRLVKIQAATIANTLAMLDEEARETYLNNQEKFVAQLDALHAELQQLLGPFKGKELFVFHPAFGYFADEYGLRQRAVETGGKEPGAQALARLLDAAALHRPGAIFVQPQYSEKSARVLAAQIGCAVVPINPLPERYLPEMRRMGEAIRASLATVPLPQ